MYRKKDHAEGKKQKVDIRELKSRAKGRWLEIFLALAPELREAIERPGKHVPCPVHGGKDGFRFFDDAAQTGGGICNTCGPKPDGFAVLQWVNDWDFPQAARAVSDWLDKNAGEVLVPSCVAKGTWGEVDPKAKDILDRIARELVRDTGRLEEYLQSRGLSGKVPEVIRFHPELEFREGKERRGYFPAMVIPLQRLDGQIVAYLRVYLHPEGLGKAPVGNPKKLTCAIWKGASRGAAIRLGEIGEILGVAEGVETALAVQESTGMPVWAAGSAGNLEAIEIPEEVRTVFVWCDHDASGRGKRAAFSLTERLLTEGFEVFVVTPPRVGTDWLDVLNQEGKDGLCQAWLNAECFELSGKIDDGPEDSPGTSDNAESDIKEIIEELNQKHAVVNVGGKTSIANLDYDPLMEREELSFSTSADFRLRYRNRKVGDKIIADIWLESPDRLQYDGLTFSPGETVPGFYNLFNGFPIPPVEGDCSLFWGHLRDNICSGNTDHFAYVKRWMSHAIQRPKELPGTAIVLRGQQGTGKGVFVETFGKLFGNHFLTVYNLEQVTGRFNSHLKNVLLLHANEVVCKGDKVGEGVLKGMITDPTVPIEYKGRDIITVPNFKRLIFATNEDWAAPLGMDDRRYLVLDVSSKRKEDSAYFKAILDQMENRGLEALMHDLLTEDLSDFDVRSIPFSESNFEQKLYNAEPVAQWLYGMLCDGCNSLGCLTDTWRTEVSHDELFALYAAWCRESHLSPGSRIHFGRKWPKLLPGVKITNSRLTVACPDVSGNETTKVRKRFYLFPELQVCREAFQRYAKSGPEIWPEAQEA